MRPLPVGRPAPAVPGVAFGEGPLALWFYKVTCPVCQMAAPRAEALREAFAERVVGVGQDSPEDLEAFGRDHGTEMAFHPDLPPYPISDAFGIEVVPTLVLVDEEGRVADVVASWDRAGYNRVGAELGHRLGVEPVAVSDPSDGLPDFAPG